MKIKDKLALREVAKIRVKNNELWMKILELAVEARPRRAKELIREITENDRRISSWLSKL